MTYSEYNRLFTCMHAWFTKHQIGENSGFLLHFKLDIIISGFLPISHVQSHDTFEELFLRHFQMIYRSNHLCTKSYDFQTHSHFQLCKFFGISIIFSIEFQKL